jgi:hypothetical protein
LFLNVGFFCFFQHHFEMVDGVVHLYPIKDCDWRIISFPTVSTSSPYSSASSAPRLCRLGGALVGSAALAPSSTTLRFWRIYSSKRLWFAVVLFLKKLNLHYNVKC